MGIISSIGGTDYHIQATAPYEPEGWLGHLLFRLVGDDSVRVDVQFLHDPPCRRCHQSLIEELEEYYDVDIRCPTRGLNFAFLIDKDAEMFLEDGEIHRLAEIVTGWLRTCRHSRRYRLSPA